MDKKYNKVLTAVLIVVVAGIIAILGYFGYTLIKGKIDKKDAESQVNEFQQEVFARSTDGQGGPAGENNGLDINSLSWNNEVASDSNSVGGNSIGTHKAAKTYHGFTMVGTIEIPSINLKLPVLDRATARSMQVSVGVVYGPGLNQVGNTVIMGHNYRNNTFFSNLKKVKIGDAIYITDTNGTRLKYQVYNMYETTAQDFSYASRDTAGAREISLSTCTDDVQGRTIVLAREAA